MVGPAVLSPNVRGPAHPRSGHPRHVPDADPVGHDDPTPDHPDTGEHGTTRGSLRQRGHHVPRQRRYGTDPTGAAHGEPVLGTDDGPNVGGNVGPDSGPEDADAIHPDSHRRGRLGPHRGAARSVVVPNILAVPVVDILIGTIPDPDGIVRTIAAGNHLVGHADEEPHARRRRPRDRVPEPVHVDGHVATHAVVRVYTHAVADAGYGGRAAAERRGTVDRDVRAGASRRRTTADAEPVHDSR